MSCSSSTRTTEWIDRIQSTRKEEKQLLPLMLHTYESAEPATVTKVLLVSAHMSGIGVLQLQGNMGMYQGIVRNQKEYRMQLIIRTNMLLLYTREIQEVTQNKLDYSGPIFGLSSQCIRIQAELDKYNAVNMRKGGNVIPNTRVSRPQLKSNHLEDRVMSNNSQGKKQEVEDHRIRLKFGNDRNWLNIMAMEIWIWRLFSKYHDISVRDLKGIDLLTGSLWHGFVFHCLSLLFLLLVVVVERR
ncbi:hypothetical protein Tco_0840071 [Tanacetum coccineum]|uniref:PH domain-containing protein n=1 Tax=Tanacetum coccineum TaxID=301880 RepID=A0ABQ5AWY6_9ASTR